MRRLMALLLAVLALAAVPAASAYNVGSDGGGPAPGTECPDFLEGVGYPVSDGWIVCLDGYWHFIPSSCNGYCPIG